MQNIKRFGVGLAALSFAGIAGAASQLDPLALTAVGTDVTDTADALMTWVLPIIGIVLAMTVGLKLFKRFSGKV